jgi:predicted metal-dependent hydrolase
MITERRHIVVSSIRVEVVRKDIKNLHLAVYPPGGHVRIAIPSRLKDETVRLAIVSRLGWIRRQRKRFESQDRQSQREVVSGETHYFRGRPYRLSLVIHAVGRTKINVRGDHRMELHSPQALDLRRRVAVLDQWYRDYLRSKVPIIIQKWEPVLGIRVDDWRIKRMKTRWGTSSSTARRVWVNVELAKKPPPCLEFVVLHEMVHFLERQHNGRFRTLMDRLMPNWRQHRDALNRAPLAHETWQY